MARHSSRVVVLSAIGWMLFAAPVFAHQLHVFACPDADGTTIRGSVYFRGGTPARDAAVIARDPAGRQIGRTKTDQQGEFSLQARFRCDHRLLVEVGAGHGAEYTVKAAELSKGLPPRGNTPIPPQDGTPQTAPPPVADAAAATPPENQRLQAVYAQLVELRKQLHEYEQSLRLRDVLGGIGYIVGIAGVAFYFLGLRRNKSASSV